MGSNSGNVALPADKAKETPTTKNKAEHGRMCFTPEEKSEIFRRLGTTEKTAANHETTIRVALGVSGSFMALLLGIAVWYLNMRENEFELLRAEMQRLNSTVIRIETQIGFYQDSFAGHVSDPQNHPNNTERVNRLIDDVRELRLEMNNNH